jgi:serine/threonine protein kinase/Flp pilus assembly protein TadD
VARPLVQIEGKYEILGKLQERGTSAVYKVRHRLLDEVRAIKILRPQVSHDQYLRDRLLKEARTAIRLRHPNVVQIHDFSLDHNSTAFIVMEFIEGLTLEALIKDFGPPPLDLAIEIAIQASEALTYLHDSGFVHRDVSPDNLMLSPDLDGQPVVKLIDLGIAQETRDQADTRTFSGKIRYASPEAFTGNAPIGPVSDLYSLGIVLYMLLTGRQPYVADTAETLIRAHLEQSPVPFSESDAYGRVPVRLRRVVMSCLEKQPQRRPRTARAIIEAFSALRSDDLATRQRLHSVLTDLLSRGPEPRAETTDLFGTTQRVLNSQFPPSNPISTQSGEIRNPARERSAEFDPLPYLGLARDSMAAGRREEAREAVEAALDVDPRLAEARQLASRLTPSPDFEAMPFDLEDTVDEIRGLIENGHVGKAAVELESARQRLGEQSDLDALQSYLEHAAANSKRGALAMPIAEAQLATTHTGLGSAHEAASEAKPHPLIARLPATLRRAWTRYEAGEIEQARALALVILKIDPGNVAALELLGSNPDPPQCLLSDDQARVEEPYDVQWDLDHEASTMPPLAGSPGDERLRDSGAFDQIDITIEPFLSRPSAMVAPAGHEFEIAPDTTVLPSLDFAAPESYPPMFQPSLPELPGADPLLPDLSVSTSRASEERDHDANVEIQERTEARLTDTGVEDLSVLAIALATEGHMDEAHATLEQARELVRDNPTASPLLVDTQQRIAEIANAEHQLGELAASEADNDVQQARQRVRSLIEQGELHQARCAINEARHQVGKLALWSVEAELDEAEANYRNEQAARLIERGRIALREEQMVAAIDLFERASKLDPSNSEAWRFYRSATKRLARVRAERGDAYERALGKIEALRARGKAEKALRRLDALAQRWNSHDEVRDLRDALVSESGQAPTHRETLA